MCTWVPKPVTAMREFLISIVFTRLLSTIITCLLKPIYYSPYGLSLRDNVPEFHEYGRIAQILPTLTRTNSQWKCSDKISLKEAWRFISVNKDLSCPTELQSFSQARTLQQIPSFLNTSPCFFMRGTCLVCASSFHFTHKGLRVSFSRQGNQGSERSGHLHWGVFLGSIIQAFLSTKPLLCSFCTHTLTYPLTCPSPTSMNWKRTLTGLVLGECVPARDAGRNRTRTRG